MEMQAPQYQGEVAETQLVEMETQHYQVSQSFDEEKTPPALANIRISSIETNNIIDNASYGKPESPFLEVVYFLEIFVKCGGKHPMPVYNTANNFSNQQSCVLQT